MKQFIILSIHLIVFTACDNFLDKGVENKKEEVTIDYSQTKKMFEPVSGLYALMRSMAFWGGYGLYAVRGDDCIKGGIDGTLDEYNYCKNFENEEIASFEFLNLYWQKLYNIIIVANSTIESLDKYKKHITSSEDITLYNEYTAQVKTLRALVYFQISKLWEYAPILYTNTTLVTKCSTEEKYTYIVSQLDEAIPYLLNTHPNKHTHPGATTKYTALAIKAKIELYRKNWSKVELITDQIINSNLFELYPSYYNLFKVEGKLCSESIFELQFLAAVDNNGVEIESEEWFVSQGPMSTPPPLYGWGYFAPSTKIANFMRTRGETIRYTTTFLECGKTTPSGDYIYPALNGEPTLYNGKAYTPSSGNAPYGSGNNIRIIRYADILLMNSEAKIMQGKNGDKPLNLVRARALMSPITDATMSDIIDERQAEFALEWGERYFDLVRHNLAQEKLPNYTNSNRYYPIPTAQLTTNPTLY